MISTKVAAKCENECLLNIIFKVNIIDTHADDEDVIGLRWGFRMGTRSIFTRVLNSIEKLCSFPHSLHRTFDSK